MSKQDLETDLMLLSWYLIITGRILIKRGEIIQKTYSSPQ